jgi:hypothetical protein
MKTSKKINSLYKKHTRKTHKNKTKNRHYKGYFFIFKISYYLACNLIFKLKKVKRNRIFPTEIEYAF